MPSRTGACLLLTPVLAYVHSTQLWSQRKYLFRLALSHAPIISPIVNPQIHHRQPFQNGRSCAVSQTGSRLFSSSLVCSSSSVMSTVSYLLNSMMNMYTSPSHMNIAGTAITDPDSMPSMIWLRLLRCRFCFAVLMLPSPLVLSLFCHGQDMRSPALTCPNMRDMYHTCLRDHTRHRLSCQQ